MIQRIHVNDKLAVEYTLDKTADILPRLEKKPFYRT